MTSKCQRFQLRSTILALTILSLCLTGGATRAWADQPDSVKSKATRSIAAPVNPSIRP